MSGFSDEEIAASLAELKAKQEAQPRKDYWLFDTVFDIAFHAGKREIRRNGAIAANSPWAESRAYCIARAAAIWAADPNRRIGDVARALLDELVHRRLKAPTGPECVADWLRRAETLSIPPQARAGGRPRKH